MTFMPLNKRENTSVLLAKIIFFTKRKAIDQDINCNDINVHATDE